MYAYIWNISKSKYLNSNLVHLALQEDM